MGFQPRMPINLVPLVVSLPCEDAEAFAKNMCDIKTSANKFPLVRSIRNM